MTGPLNVLADFANALRAEGLTVTPDQVGDMARAVSLVDVSSRDRLHDAFQCLAIADPAHRLPFDRVFRRFFFGTTVPEEADASVTPAAVSFLVKPIVSSEEPTETEETKSQVGASNVRAFEHRDFATLDPDDLAEARRMVMAMSWQPSDVKTRRWVPSPLGSQPDLRRTLRGTVRPTGDLMPIITRRRRLRQRPLIVIADISGSMEKYAEMFLVFAHAAQRRLENVEVFTFSTRLTRITTELHRRDTVGALSLVTNAVTDWSGGTMIGEALQDWNRLWSRRLSRGGPVAMILSDGWDCGDPALLSLEMGRLARTVHKVIWLNPLAARPDYSPATRGMQAALPHVDHLVPAASVNDLRSVVRLLDGLIL